MADLLFVALLGVLFGATVGFVRLCDRMLGADEVIGTAPAISEQPQERVAA